MILYIFTKPIDCADRDAILNNLLCIFKYLMALFNHEKFLVRFNQVCYKQN